MRSLNWVLTTSLALAAAACGATETEEPTGDVGGDLGDTSGSDAADDGTGAGDTGETDADSGEDAADDATDGTGSADSGGDVAEDGTGSTDVSGDTADDGTGSTDVGGDTADASPDVSDDVEACLMACGVGCPPPDFWLCASNGERYCNDCIIGCYGLTVASDAVCDGTCTAGETRMEDCNTCTCLSDGSWACTDMACPNPCDPPADATPIEYTMWTPPTDCMIDPFARDLYSVVLVDEDGFQEAYGCLSGIDWNVSRLVVAVMDFNPYSAIRGIVGDAESITVYQGAEVYCGGAAPPDSVSFALIAAGSTPVSFNTCTYGECEGGPFP